MSNYESLKSIAETLGSSVETVLIFFKQVRLIDVVEIFPSAVRDPIRWDTELCDEYIKEVIILAIMRDNNK